MAMDAKEFAKRIDALPDGTPDWQKQRKAIQSLAVASPKVAEVALKAAEAQAAREVKQSSKAAEAAAKVEEAAKLAEEREGFRKQAMETITSYLGKSGGKVKEAIEDARMNGITVELFLGELPDEAQRIHFRIKAHKGGRTGHASSIDLAGIEPGTRLCLMTPRLGIIAKGEVVDVKGEGQQPYRGIKPHKDDPLASEPPFGSRRTWATACMNKRGSKGAYSGSGWVFALPEGKAKPDEGATPLG